MYSLYYPEKESIIKLHFISFVPLAPLKLSARTHFIITIVSVYSNKVNTNNVYFLYNTPRHIVVMVTVSYFNRNFKAVQLSVHC